MTFAMVPLSMIRPGTAGRRFRWPACPLMSLHVPSYCSQPVVFCTDPAQFPVSIAGLDCKGKPSKTTPTCFSVLQEPAFSFVRRQGCDPFPAPVKDAGIVPHGKGITTYSRFPDLQDFYDLGNYAIDNVQKSLSGGYCFCGLSMSGTSFLLSREYNFYTDWWF